MFFVLGFYVKHLENKNKNVKMQITAVPKNCPRSYLKVLLHANYCKQEEKERREDMHPLLN